MLPGMNGYELAAAIKRLRPEIKVVFMSGYAPEEIQASTLLELEAAFLAKPVNCRALLETVNGVLAAPD